MNRDPPTLGIGKIIELQKGDVVILAHRLTLAEQRALVGDHVLSLRAQGEEAQREEAQRGERDDREWCFFKKKRHSVSLLDR